MKLRKSLKWVDSPPVCLPLISSLLFATIAFLGSYHKAKGQDVQFTQIEAPFDVFDEQGQRFSLPFLGGFNVPRPQFVDIDGDGDQDLFIQERSNELIFFEHDSSADDFPFVKQSDVFLDLEIGEWYRFVDLDQDGDQDLLTESPFSFIRVYENTGSGASPAFMVAQDSLRDESGNPIFADRQNILNVVDIDSDQLLDLFIGRLDGTLFHYEQTAGEAGVQDITFSLVSEKFQNISVVGVGGKQDGQHGANTLHFFDVDEDEDLDLFWGDFFEPGLLFFENVGSPQIPLFLTDLLQFPIDNPLMTSGYNAPAFGDANGDGKEDLLVGVLGGAFSAFGAATNNLLYYEHGAGNQFTFVRPLFFSNIDVGSDGYPVLFDVDGDGDNDLLLGNSIDPDDTNAGSLRLFENIGSSNAPVFQDRGKLPLEAEFGITPALGDLNGDGAIDMITGSFGGAMTLYWNANSGDTFSFSQSVPGFLDIPTGGSSAPFLADLDADQDLDLLVGQSSGVLNYFENTGTAEQPQFTLITSSYGDIDVGRRSAPVATDVDGDGDLDLIIGSDSDGIQLFENIGTPQNAAFVPADWFDVEIQRRMVPAWGDLNGDLKPELLIGLLNGGVQYYESIGGPTSTQEEAVPGEINVELFPNPARERVGLKISGVSNQRVEIKIYNLLGQYMGPVFQGFNDGDVLSVSTDLSALAPGVYVVSIEFGSVSIQRLVAKVR